MQIEQLIINALFPKINWDAVSEPEESDDDYNENPLNKSQSKKNDPLKEEKRRMKDEIN